MSEVDHEVKKQINEEGFEGNAEGGAAVVIGKKEGGEIDRLRQNVENEGICADAATYIKLNKTIAVPAEKVPEEIKKQVGKGWIGSSDFNFIDREGNIAAVRIDYKKITSIPKDAGWQKEVDAFVKELEQYNFSIKKFTDQSYDPVNRLRIEHKEQVEKSLKAKGEREFDF